MRSATWCQCPAPEVGELVPVIAAVAEIEHPARVVCDRHLLLELLADLAPRHDLARELGLESPLVLQGILRVDRTRGPFAGLAADPRIIERFAGLRIDHGSSPASPASPPRSSSRTFWGMTG